MYENVRRAKEKLDEMSAILGEILEGRMTQKQAATKLGISSQTFGRETRSLNPFSAYFKKNEFLDESTAFSLLRSIETPCESLAKDILGIRYIEELQGKILLLDIESQPNFIRTIKEWLSPREYEVLTLYYGLDSFDFPPKRMTLNETSNTLGLTREKIRQIKSYALTRLREPNILGGIFPLYNKYMRTIQELECLRKTNQDLQARCEAALADIHWMESQIKFCNSVEAFKKETMGNTIISDYPGFSKKWIIALEENGLTTILDITSLSPDHVRDIANKYNLDISELIISCRKIHIEAAFIQKVRSVSFDSLECLDLSMRSYNALKRVGINTVEDIAKMRKSNLSSIRSLGKCSLKEICEKMLLLYGVELQD